MANLLEEYAKVVVKLSNKHFDLIVAEVEENAEMYISDYNTYSYDIWDIFEQVWNKSEDHGLPEMTKNDVYRRLIRERNIEDTVYEILQEKNMEMYRGVVQ